MAGTRCHTALITGSSDTQSLGYEIARQLCVQHSFDTVFLTGRKAETVQAAADALRSQLAAETVGVDSSAVTVHALTLDVTSQASIEAAFETLSSANGPLAHVDNRLDVLVNSAGVGAPPNRAGKGQQTMFLSTELTTTEDVEHVMRTNVAAVVAVTSPYIISQPRDMLYCP
jgi:NAD(P)-dependent dehydrogenase (short-subunit alcohol dehydrogenase family)